MIVVALSKKAMMCRPCSPSVAHRQHYSCGRVSSVILAVVAAGSQQVLRLELALRSVRPFERRVEATVESIDMYPLPQRLRHLLCPGPVFVVGQLPH
jgi:hypothetical protein